MNNTLLNIQAHTLSLKRFPSNQFDKSLRAWDAADEYMIDHVTQTHTMDELSHIVIVNDSFGALTCAMAKLAPLARISVFTDSFMSQQGIKQNLRGSNLDKNNVEIFSSLHLNRLGNSNASPVDLVLLKVPRTLSYLEYLTASLNASVLTSSQATPPIMVSGAMVKLVTSSVMKIFDRTVSNTTTSLARKKARLIFSEFSHPFDKEIARQEPHNANISAPVLKVQDPELTFELYNYPNVFCREQVDIGARYMLKALPKIHKASQLVVDLGCGNGILGTSILLQHPNNPPKVIYVDESYMAIASAKVTLANSNVSENAKAKAEFVVGHCLGELIVQYQGIAHAGVDLVICNPPFHQQNTIIDDIAWQMFIDAKKVLKVGGELRIVGNRHLDHKAKLSKLFGRCNVVANDKKFIVLSAIKQA